MSASAPSVARLGATEPAAKIQTVALKAPAAQGKAKVESEDKLAMITQRVNALEHAYEHLTENFDAGGKITSQLNLFAAQPAADKTAVENYVQGKEETHRQELKALDTLFAALRMPRRRLALLGRGARIGTCRVEVQGVVPTNSQ